MKCLSQKEQKYAVEKVLYEMEKAEECLLSWNLNWREEYLGAYSPVLHKIGNQELLYELQDKYNGKYKLENVIKGESIGYPLKSETIEGLDPKVEYDVDFSCVKWWDAISKTCRRLFMFTNDGQINFWKSPVNSKTNTYGYETEFNVLDKDFNLLIYRNYKSNDDKKEERTDVISYGITDNKFTMMFNGVGKIIDLETGVVTGKTGNRNYYDKEMIEEAVRKVIETVKTIRGELPLPGLIDRINYSFMILAGMKTNKQGRRR